MELRALPAVEPTAPEPAPAIGAEWVTPGVMLRKDLNATCVRLWKIRQNSQSRASLEGLDIVSKRFVWIKCMPTTPEPKK